MISNQFTSFDDNTTSSIEEIEFEETDELVQVIVTPNPFAQQAVFNLKTAAPLNEEVVIYIYNELGQLMKILRTRFSNNQEISIELDDISDWPSGVYHCKVRIGEAMKTLKLVKHG